MFNKKFLLGLLKGKTPHTNHQITEVERETSFVAELTAAIRRQIGDFVHAESLEASGVNLIEVELGEVEYAHKDEGKQIKKAVIVQIYCVRPGVLLCNSVLHPLRKKIFLTVLNIMDKNKFIKIEVIERSPYK